VAYLTGAIIMRLIPPTALPIFYRLITRLGYDNIKSYDYLCRFMIDQNRPSTSGQAELPTLYGLCRYSLQLWC